MGKKLYIFKLKHFAKTRTLVFLGALLVSILFVAPSYSHWSDLTVAEVVVGRTETQMILTFPTGLVAFADDNKDNQLTPSEVIVHNSELQSFLTERIRFSDRQNQIATLKVLSSNTANPSLGLKVTGSTHSTLDLRFSWQKAVEGIKIHYNFFLPNVPTATCFATISSKGELQNFTFSPTNQDYLPSEFTWLAGGNLFLAISAAFVWGLMHAFSPGHGKTIVGAYLVGSHATSQQALILGLTTTITHTIGVFSLGLIALFAYQFILPEQIYPWLNLISGLMVVLVGANLLVRRSHNIPFLNKYVDAAPDHSHSHEHIHEHSHETGHNHPHDHSHSHESTGMRSLVALGISGGLLPCPAALVLMLSAISLGQIGLGLGLVLSFSLGLASVLTGLGLMLVNAKQLFKKLPTEITLIKKFQLLKNLPALSALCITLLGLGITLQALLQIIQIRL